MLIEVGFVSWFTAFVSGGRSSGFERLACIDENAGTFFGGQSGFRWKACYASGPVQITSGDGCRLNSVMLFRKSLHKIIILNELLVWRAILAGAEHLLQGGV